jgi:hypothetical protein
MPSRSYDRKLETVTAIKTNAGAKPRIFQLSARSFRLVSVGTKARVSWLSGREMHETLDKFNCLESYIREIQLHNIYDFDNSEFQVDQCNICTAEQF